MMKKTVMLLTLLVAHVTQSVSLPFDRMLANKNWYKPQAKQWVNEYLLSVPHHDLCLIANVLYYAWARSTANLSTQRYVEDSLQAMVEVAHTFDVTRLTPARYFTTKQPYIEPLNKLHQALEAHEAASKTYHQALSLIIDKEALESINAQEALTKTRTHARAAVAQGVASIATHFDELLSQAHTWLESVVKILFKNKPINTSESKAIFQTLWKYIEHLLAKAFIASDNKYATAWYDCAQALLIPHDLHNALWNVMEQVRTAFYQAHFEAVYDYMQELHIENNCFIQIDQRGWISNATQLIPEPHSLFNSFALS